MGHSEIELKLELAAAADLRALERNHLPDDKNQQPERKEVISVYFDTAKLKLRRRGLSLRVRRVDGRHVQTIKRSGDGDGAALAMDEWESEIEGDTPICAPRAVPRSSRF
jgi:inorganic triphosphatase YgiF